MIFEMEKKMDPQVIHINKDHLELTKREINREVAKINSFIEEFNAAHLGMPIKFKPSYTNALMQDRLPSIAGDDFAKYVSESPKFLQEQLHASYKEFIEPVYTKANNISRNWLSISYKICQELCINDLKGFICINEDGIVSITSELETLIQDRYTIKSTDINPVFAEKIEEYIRLENELKSIVGKSNFRPILSSQCTNESRYDFNHSFDLKKLICFVKDKGYNTYGKRNQES